MQWGWSGELTLFYFEPFGCCRYLQSQPSFGQDQIVLGEFTHVHAHTHTGLGGPPGLIQL